MSSTSSSTDSRHGPIVLLTGTANVPLANAVAEHLGTKCKVVTTEFSNGETGANIEESVRDSDVYIIQPTAGVNTNTLNMELFIMLQTAKLASPHRITAVVPCLAYARQDRKSKPREPITAKLVADIITLSGAHRVLSVDLHADQIQGFFGCPVDHLSAENFFVRYVLEQFGKKDGEEAKKIVVVSPDAGGVKRARNVTNKLLANGLAADLAIIHKERPRANEINEESMKLVGDVRGGVAIIVDDIVDTGGTLLKAAKMLKNVGGASYVLAMATHGVLSGKAFEKMFQTPNNCLNELVVTNTIDVNKAMAAQRVVLPQNDGSYTKFTILDISHILAEAIRRSHSGASLSELFDLKKFPFKIVPLT